MAGTRPSQGTKKKTPGKAAEKAAASQGAKKKAAAARKRAAGAGASRTSPRSVLASAAAKARSTARAGARAGGERAVAIRHWSSRRGRAALLILRSLAALLLSLCAIEIFRLTLTPSPASVGIAHANLHPFATIRLYLRHGSLRQQILQIGGNIAIGVPFGFLLPQITPRLRGLLRVVGVTCVFVTLIELAQWLFVRGRAFDVDDVICAAAGAALGYVPLGRMFGMRLHPHHLHWWQRLLARRRTPGAAAPGARPRKQSQTRTRTYGVARGERPNRGTAAAAPRRAGRGG